MDYENETNYENEIVPNDEYVELVKYEGDWGNNISKIFSVLSIICAGLGIFAIFSYPLIYVISLFYNIDKFMPLPIGYSASVEFPDLPLVEILTMLIFAILCFRFAVKLYKWLTSGFSIVSRITCFICGIVFMYFMISKEANALLIVGLELIVIIVMFALVLLPLMIFSLLFVFYYCSPFQLILPEPAKFAKNYYSKLFGLIFRK